jgi:hypothetical protein
MQFFEIQYETPPGLPPPYCYYFHLVGRVEQGVPQVKFDWVYNHREDLSEEEITAEGFTGDDDYHWQGALHETWLHQLEKNVDRTKAVAHPDEEGPYLHVTAEAAGRVLFRGHPRNLTEWEYFLQELVQAIYETAGKEAPLRLRFRKVAPGAPAVEAKVEIRFRDRAVVRSGPGPAAGALPWEAMQGELQSIYALQYDAEAALPKVPGEPGHYLDPGEGHWYELGKSATNPSARKNYVAAVTRFIDELLG